VIRVGIDVGGTFTDLVCIDDATGQISALKVPSTTGREHDGFVDGVQSLALERPLDQIVHGTTVATNALLQKKGGRVAMICTRGFRDVLEIGRCMRYAHGSLFDSKFVKPDPLVPRDSRIEVGERIGPDGAVLLEVDIDDVAAAIKSLKEVDAQSIAICFINSYANSDHENAVKEAILKAFPDTHICTSIEVHRGHQEFERFATTALNAFLMPPMAKYLSVLETSLRQNKIDAPVLIMSSSGGTLSPSSASRLPVRTILSGPVGGVTASISLGEALGIDDLITYDMGGTSTDVCVIRKGHALTTEQVILAGLPVRGSMLEINTVGAGAGSIARFEDDGTLLVGPESAGSIPGPACYGTGSQLATVTDANLVLGRLNPARALGDRIQPNAAEARAALQRVADDVGSISVEDLSEGVIRIAVAKMAGAIREISVSRGLDPRRFTLVAYGGAGPMHGALVAEELGISRVLVPRLPGNFSAIGLLTADLRWDATRSMFSRLDATGLEEIKTAVATLKDEVAGYLKRDGGNTSQLEFEIYIQMNYIGQASSFSVRADDADISVERLHQAFLTQYEDRYGNANPDRQIAVSGVRVVAVATSQKPDMKSFSAGGRAGKQKAISRKVTFQGVEWDCAVLLRDLFVGEESAEGPAIIEESGATTVVPPGWDFQVDKLLNITLIRKSGKKLQ
jgi:N-methylhydantoinase A